MSGLQPIFVDVYPDDLHGHPNWAAAAAAPQVNGAILKVSQGQGAMPSSWLAPNWQAIHAVDRKVGQDWFCGGYHYLVCHESGAGQAELFVKTLESAGGGGLQPTDLWPIVDVELPCNPGVTAAQFEDVTSAFAARIRQLLGRSTMLYGGSALRDLGITSHMGCSWLWTACYAPALPESEITRMGWSEASLWGWQYQGTGAPNIGRLAGYPTQIPGFAGPAGVDTTVMVFPGGLAQLPAALET
jgi:GH25 family lysozyme M1 (1,4-beta-N-acetylmuramidase)